MKKTLYESLGLSNLIECINQAIDKKLDKIDPELLDIINNLSNLEGIDNLLDLSNILGRLDLAESDIKTLISELFGENSDNGNKNFTWGQVLDAIKRYVGLNPDPNYDTIEKISKILNKLLGGSKTPNEIESISDLLSFTPISDETINDLFK